MLFNRQTHHQIFLSLPYVPINYADVEDNEGRDYL